RQDVLRRIEVYSAYRPKEWEVPEEELRVPGKMSDAKRARLREAIVKRWHREHGRPTATTVTQSRLQALAAIEHVQAVIPKVQLDGQVVFNHRDEPVVATVSIPEDRYYRNRLVAGDFWTDPD